jgi:hypothetical protein
MWKRRWIGVEKRGKTRLDFPRGIAWTSVDERGMGVEWSVEKSKLHRVECLSTPFHAIPRRSTLPGNSTIFSAECALKSVEQRYLVPPLFMV